MKNKYLYTTMGCQKLDTDFCNFLEIAYSEKRGYGGKKSVNYYPFGLEHKGYNNVTSGNVNSVATKFKYNGIELEESLGLNLYEMELRLYDPAIARWNAIDPVTHYSYSTYSAFDNNPVFWADPSGANAELSDEISDDKSYSKTIISSSIDADGNTSVIMRTYSTNTITNEDGTKTTTQSYTFTTNTISNEEGNEGNIVAGGSFSISQTNTFSANGELKTEGNKNLEIGVSVNNSDKKVLDAWTNHIADYNRSNGSHKTWNEKVLDEGIPLVASALSSGPTATLIGATPKGSTANVDNAKKQSGFITAGLIYFAQKSIDSSNKHLILSNQDRVNGVPMNNHRTPRKPEDGTSLIKPILNAFEWVSKLF